MLRKVTMVVSLCYNSPLEKMERSFSLHFGTGYMYVSMCGHHTISKGNDPLGKVANPARAQLNRENEHFPVPVRA